MKKLCIPSFALEATTRAASRLVVGALFLLQTLTIVLPAFFILSFGASMLGHLNVVTLQSTYLLFVSIFFMVFSIIPIISGLYPLIYAYRIEDDKITRGGLCRLPADDKGNSLVDAVGSEAVLTASAALASISSAEAGATLSYAATKKDNWVALIIRNTDPTFVETYFDTICYKKKEYAQPVLVKETAKSFVYRCARNRKLVIPKLYTNMGAVGTHKPLNLWLRLKKSLQRSFIAGIACGLLLLGLSAVVSDTYREASTPIIEAQIVALGDELSPLGYEYTLPLFWQEGDYLTEATFIYHDADILDEYLINQVTYEFAVDGSVQSLSFELYFTAQSTDITQQVSGILATAPNTFSQETLDQITAAIIGIQGGSYTFDTMRSEDGKCSVKVMRYNDYYYVKTVDD